VRARGDFPALFHPHVQGGIENWPAPQANVEQLAKLFDLAEPEQSVYEVADGEEEWLTAAAHVLASPKQGVDAVSLLRVRQEELGRFGIAVDPRQPGTTGVVWIDHRHRNLRASREKLIELVRFLAEECRRGHDKVRRIVKEHVARSLRRLCEQSATECPPHVKLVARWALKETDGPVLDRLEAYKEMLLAELPDEVIRPRAHRLGGEDAVASWYAALQELRQEYAGHYEQALASRFGLR
jgi:hypothetical protein